MVSNRFHEYSKRVCGGKVRKLSKSCLATVPKPDFLLREQMGDASHVFSVAEQKGFPTTIRKPCFFLLWEEMGVLKTTKGMLFMLKRIAGSVFCFFVAGAG